MIIVGYLLFCDDEPAAVDCNALKTCTETCIGGKQQENEINVKMFQLKVVINSIMFTLRCSSKLSVREGVCTKCGIFN